MNFSNPWPLFCFAFGLMLLAAYLMKKLEKEFYTQYPVKRKFTMLEMEFPNKYSDIKYLISGIYKLPQNEKATTLKAVKWQLLIDSFLYVPAVYGGIFILCMTVGNKLQLYYGKDFFYFLAYAQFLCLILDYIENILFSWLFKRWKDEKDIIPIKAGAIASQHVMSNENTNGSQKEKIKTDYPLIGLRLLEGLKWTPSMLGAICGFSAVIYFWLSGKYSTSSIPYIVSVLLMLIIFIIISLKKTKPKIYNTVDQMPVPNYDLDKYLTDKIDKIEGVQRGMIKGCVSVKFVVNEQGNITSEPAPQIIRSPGGKCDDEAIRIVKEMQTWKCGKQKGKPVKVFMEITLCFKNSKIND